MVCNDCNKKPVATQYLADVAIDTLDSLPEYLIAERDAEDPISGDTVRALVRVPAGKLFPNGNYDNLTTIVANNDALEIPEREVRAGYVQNNVSSVQVLPADAEHHADFLILGRLADMFMIQNTGFVNIPAGHDYVISQQYYLGESGEPVTDATITGQKLFKPISRTQLAINLGE